MRKALIIMALLISSLTFSQEVLTFTDVVQVEGVTKTELYNRAKIWFSETFKDSKEVIQSEDKEEGYIIGKGTMVFKQSFLSGSDTTNGYIDYTVKIYLKEGRYKYEITNFTHNPTGGKYGKTEFGVLTIAETTDKKGMSGKKWTKRVWDELKDNSNSTATILIESLNKKMSEKIEVKNSDW